MNSFNKLDKHLRNRAIDITKMKDEGRKVIAYTPGGYMPEELVYACDALPIPVGLIRGGEHEPVMTAGVYLPRWLDTFCRAQIGYYMLKDDALYQMVDLLVTPLTDNDIRAIADSWDYYTDIEVFRFGVPHAKTDHAFDYYLEGLALLKDKLERLTDTQITDEKLKDAIELSNRERNLFKEISLMRKADPPLVTEEEFIKLSHASFLADKKIMVEVLEEFCDEIESREPPPAKGPRILLTGSTLAMGDYKILNLVRETGGTIVIEEFCEGIRQYWENVEIDADIMKSLAERYFLRRVPGAWARPGKERLDFLIKLAKDFKVEGVTWYQLMYRAVYDIESFYFKDRLKKDTGISMLKISSDYDPTETETLRTRIETFIETLKR